MDEDQFHVAINHRLDEIQIAVNAYLYILISAILVVLLAGIYHLINSSRSSFNHRQEQTYQPEDLELVGWQIPLEADGILSKYKHPFLVVQVIKHYLYNYGSVLVRVTCNGKEFEALPGDQITLTSPVRICYYRRHVVDAVAIVEDTGPVQFKIIKIVQIYKAKIPKFYYSLRYLPIKNLTLKTIRGKIHLLGCERYVGLDQVLLPGIGFKGAFRRTADGVQLFNGRKLVTTQKQVLLEISSDYLMMTPSWQNIVIE